MVTSSLRIAIVGATASGKSAVADAVCAALATRGQRAEIVSMDSMCVYRGMDVGTAKPSAGDRARIAHHLIDLVDPDTEFSVGEFQRCALEAITGIEARGAVPVLVGGTGLYVDAVIDELTIPGRYPEVRAALEAELAAHVDVTVLHERLRVLDPLAASRMEPTNTRRVVRALEVTIGAGRPFSSFGPGLQPSASTGATAAPTATRASRYRMIGLQWARPALATRIEERFAQQLRDGFLDEARRLLDTYGDSLSRTARQALGYRELWTCIETSGDVDDAIADAILRTRQFAVRQERWFRRDPRITWVDAHTSPEDIADAIVAGAPADNPADADGDRADDAGRGPAVLPEHGTQHPPGIHTT